MSNYYQRYIGKHIFHVFLGFIIFNSIVHILILHIVFFLNTKISLITKFPSLYWIKIFLNKKNMKQININTCNSSVYDFKICKSAIHSLRMCITFNIFDNLILYIKCHIRLLTDLWRPFTQVFLVFKHICIGN